MNVAQLTEMLLKNPSVRDKVLIERTYAPNGNTVVIDGADVRLGDDCAAIPDGHGGYTLFAAEGLIEPFVSREPWFAGYSAVMVNISDICAMGGLPTALTNVIWSIDAPDSAELWEGMLAACRAFDVPMVGGHTCYNSTRHLAVSIIGRANQLITSFDAQPNDVLMLVIDMDGAYYKNYPFWNGSTHKSPADNQRQMRLLYDIANADLVTAGKDISMGGMVGTLHMLTQTSRVGALLDLDAIPVPADVPLDKWLTSFPSYGYLLTCPPSAVDAVTSLFTKQGVVAKPIGNITADPAIYLRYQHETVLFTQPQLSEFPH